MKYLEACLANSIDKELLGCLFKNAKGSVLKFEIISEGTFNQVSIPMREIFKRCIELNATSIIICHNHPLFDSEPSIPDLTSTKELKTVGEMLGIYLVDDIIIGQPGKHYSMMEDGLLPWKLKKDDSSSEKEISNDRAIEKLKSIISNADFMTKKELLNKLTRLLYQSSE